jgi:hypothetical protein
MARAGHGRVRHRPVSRAGGRAHGSTDAPRRMPAGRRATSHRSAVNRPADHTLSKVGRPGAGAGARHPLREVLAIMTAHPDWVPARVLTLTSTVLLALGLWAPSPTAGTHAWP